MRFWKLSLASLTATAALIALPQTGHAQATVTVVEYMNVLSNVRFITGRVDEQALLDSLPQTFKRTGSTFAARPAASASGSYQAVCRYRIDITSGYSTHFYGLPADCALIQDLVSRNVITNFFYEGLDFAVEPAVSGACPGSSPVAIRRALRLTTPVEAANHRYATNMTDYQDALSQGWAGENIAFCAPSATAETPRPSYAAGEALRNFCAAPRTGASPVTGQPYPDVQGTLQNEKEWIRYWVDRSYLWYREVPTVTSNFSESVTGYFGRLKSPAVAVAGGAKDRFSFSTSTASVENTDAGIVFGYGIQWSAKRSSPPREWVASVVAPGSPAAAAGVARGDRILQIDGVDFVSGNDVNTLNRGLFPPAIGENHSFVLQAVDGNSKSVTLTSASLPLVSVPVSGVINTPTGKVGYIAFTTFNSFTAEKAIADAIAGLVPQGINDLVLDLRYNGGGYIYISSQLAYMVAGAAKTNGKVFERTLTNDKKPFGQDTVYPFYNVGSGFAGGVANGQALPTLNLNRIFVLTTGASCSASEAFINALRGLDMPVITIGTPTCGKPYGFSGRDNCGTTYYPIQFTGVNQKGEGDFINGFAATCASTDDLSKSLGDPSERMLAAALAYRANGTCAPASSVSKQALSPESEEGHVGENEISTLKLKLETPNGLSRNAGGIIVPRTPLDLDRAFAPNR